MSLFIWTFNVHLISLVDPQDPNKQTRLINSEVNFNRSPILKMGKDKDQQNFYSSFLTQNRVKGCQKEIEEFQKKLIEF